MMKTILKSALGRRQRFGRCADGSQRLEARRRARLGDAIRILLREEGQPLERGARRVMESGLSADFRDVVIHTSRLSDRVNAALGTLAFTMGNHVCFSRSAYDSTSDSGRLLLAHELAHVVQQRLGTRTSRTHRLAAEVEADAAAWNVLQGRRHLCAVPLRPGTLAAWGPAGHYYTVYYVLLAAGLGDDNARRMAFFTQLSDQVYELDAVSVAGDMINAIPDQAPGDIDHSPGAALERARQIQNVFDVQAGLHCLTGRGSRKETAARAHVVLGCKVESDVGLALHPFGDSFAHRQLDDVKTMYKWKFGHAFDGHKADKIHERPWLYYDYVAELYDLACENWPAANRRIGLEQLLAKVGVIANETLEERQIGTIRALSLEMRCALHEYKPEKEAKTSWNKFLQLHPALNRMYLTRALDLARSWAHVSATYGGALRREHEPPRPVPPAQPARGLPRDPTGTYDISGHRVKPPGGW